MCLLASSAGAKIVVDKVTGLKLSILRPPLPPAASNRSQRQTPGFAGPTCDNVTPVDSNCAHPLVYHGGPVQHAENDYLFFWGPSSFTTSSYVTGMQQWLNDLAAGDYTTGAASPVGNPISVTQEYYDHTGPGKAKRFAAYGVRNAGTILDNDGYPANGCTDKYTDWFNGNTPVTLARCLTQKQLYTELSHYIANHPQLHLPTGVNTEYFILTPQNVGSCSNNTTSDCAITDYCAWHSLGGTTAHTIVYAYQPWLGGTTCDVNRVNSFTNLYSSGIDSVVGTFSHELAETMTDPTLRGWYSDSFDEIGDKCAYQYDVGVQPFETFTGLPTVSGTPYNAVLGTDNYLLQEEFDNRNSGCNQWDTDLQPAATVTAPSGATTGLPATFSIGNYSGVGTGPAYVTWHFGDGSTATSVGTAPINHYYQAAGSYPVTAIVTDTHGNEVQEAAGSNVAVTGPTQSDLQTAVDAPIKPTGAGAKIENILANSGYTFTFSTLAAGTFHMAWTHGATTVATITRALSILGPNGLKIALTSAGRSLLNSHNSLSIASTDRFVSSGNPTVTDTSAFTLVR
jgi:hypothetical protein